MRNTLLISSLFFLTVACAPDAAKTVPAESQGPSVFDVASPDEVAEELGLPATETAAPAANFVPFSLQQQNRVATIDLTQYFPVVIIVNKANSGPTAQTMKVYHRGALAYTFPVSTGRETPENNTKSGRVYFSTTPTGFYSPTETVEKHFSILWQAWMNNAIFFNGGIALHATTPEHYKELGHRASGGCVRLLPKNAKIVWDLVLAEGKGDVPVISRTGQIQKSLFGKVDTAKNWNTLIIVEENTNE